MPDPEHLKSILDIITALITIVGVPTGIYAYIQSKKKERHEREYLAYDSLDDKYIDFLTLCLEHAELDIYWGGTTPEKVLTEEEKKKRIIIYEILVSLLERAYLLYREQSKTIQQRQGKGWDGYAAQWMKNKNFSEAWVSIADQYDSNFVAHMNNVYKKVNKEL